MLRPAARVGAAGATVALPGAYQGWPCAHTILGQHNST